ncbi:glycosyltransferase family 9 protein, partial [Lacticaseibacillus paracasei]
MIKHSLAVGANDNYLLHVAAVFNIPSVGLYSCFRPGNTKPVWNQDKHWAIESNREGNLPSYSRRIETPPTINFI